MSDFDTRAANASCALRLARLSHKCELEDILEHKTSNTLLY